MTRVAVVGAGRWGINHVRAGSRMRTIELAMICDASDAALGRAKAFAPKARTVKRFEEVLESDVDAVVLATPAIAHAEMARAALDAGKHVLVEKPLALNVADAEACVDAAERSGKVLMVGHLMLYHACVQKLRDLVRSGDLGRVYYMYALRVNLGTMRHDENAMWSLAPHDISMMIHLLDEEPVSVSARGGQYLQKGIDDVAFVNLRFESGIIAQIQLSWLDPRKERRLTIVGSKKMVEFDDVHPTEKLRIHDKGYEIEPTFTSYAEFVTLRSGDIHIPRVPAGEPLDNEWRHFTDCVQQGRNPLTDGRSGLAVVRVLEAAQQSLNRDGTSVDLRPT